MWVVRALSMRVVRICDHFPVLLPPTHETPPSLALQELSPYQAVHAVASTPNPLQYLSFVFGLGNLLAGPYLEYVDYDNFMNLKGVRGWARLKQEQHYVSDRGRNGARLRQKQPYVSDWGQETGQG